MFDRHRSNGTCVNPSTLSDCELRDGVWGRPQMSEDEKSRFVEARRA